MLSHSEDRLEYLVGRASGSQTQLSIFQHLLKNTFNKDGIYLFDTRVGQSLLFIFPPIVQVYLSILFYEEELKIGKKYSEFDSDIATPLEVIKIACAESNMTIPTYIASIFVDDNYKDKLIKLFNFIPKSKFLREQTLEVCNKFNFFNPSLEEIASQITNNDKISAAYLIAKEFKYSEYISKEISQFYELELYKPTAA